MQLKRATTAVTSDDSVLPLINIVFLLLIFFMVAGQIKLVTPFQVNPPETTTDVNDLENSQQEYIIYLSSSGEIAYQGDVLDDNDLSRKLNADVDENIEIEMQLLADKETEAQRVIEIMTIVRDSGIDKIFILTTEE